MILYSANDMVKAGTNDCRGCSQCCRGMGDSILLDPYDIYMLQTATGQTFSQLLQEKIGLHVEEGLILPAMKIQEDTDACGFLKEGRCSIHDYRPGLCRLFPLGRNYDEQGIRYFMLDDACSAGNRTKVKIKKWLDVELLPRYEEYLIVWHDIRKNIQQKIMERKSDEYTHQVNVAFLEIFYQMPYQVQQDFYPQFEQRCQSEKAAGICGR